MRNDCHTCNIGTMILGCGLTIQVDKTTVRGESRACVSITIYQPLGTLVPQVGCTYTGYCGLRMSEKRDLPYQPGLVRARAYRAWLAWSSRIGRVKVA
jgi:hypothetical protein